MTIESNNRGNQIISIRQQSNPDYDRHLRGVVKVQGSEGDRVSNDMSGLETESAFHYQKRGSLHVLTQNGRVLDSFRGTTMSNAYYMRVWNQSNRLKISDVSVNVYEPES